MTVHDVLVIGGGISGAGFASHAAHNGRSVLLVEADEEVGGCLRSVRTPEGYWYELGAHTCYNSYGAFLELLEQADLLGDLQLRGKPSLRFIEGDRVLPGQNLGLLLRRFNKLELLCAMPRWFGADPVGHTVAEYYGRLVGPRNFERVLGPMLAAVPSQRADDFPADLLFKKRPRRKEIPRSFTLPRGLGTAVEKLLAAPGIEVRRGSPAVSLTSSGGGAGETLYTATLASGEQVEARRVALAVPPAAAASLLRKVLPEVSALVEQLEEVRVMSTGFVVRRADVTVPYATFLIPLDDVFHSMVTRDVVPDPDWRAFTVHFRPGLSLTERLARAARFLGLAPRDLFHVTERTAVLPSPKGDHVERIEAIDAALAGAPDAGGLALTGNWFSGLSIEDCALRSRSEWERVQALAAC